MQIAQMGAPRSIAYRGPPSERWEDAADDASVILSFLATDVLRQMRFNALPLPVAQHNEQNRRCRDCGWRSFKAALSAFVSSNNSTTAWRNLKFSASRNAWRLFRWQLSATLSCLPNSRSDGFRSTILVLNTNTRPIPNSIGAPSSSKWSVALSPAEITRRNQYDRQSRWQKHLQSWVSVGLSTRLTKNVRPIVRVAAVLSQVRDETRKLSAMSFEPASRFGVAIRRQARHPSKLRPCTSSAQRSLHRQF
jgi:hypothetical protein